MNLFIRKTALAAAAILAALAASGQQKVQIAAHRGVWQSREADGAQNSIASLKVAQEMGLWGSEFDLQLTADDVILVHHDNHHGTALIWNNPRDAFKDVRLKNGEPIPTLDELLVQGEKSPETVLVVELKHQKDKAREDRLTDMTIDALKAHGLFDPARAIFISFSMNICERLVSKAPGFTIQYLNGDIAPAELHRKGINGIDYHYKVFHAHPEWVAEAHDLGMSVNVWTVDKPEDIRAMIDLGVDCITTNVPERVRAALGDRELRNVPPTEDDPLANPKAVVTAGKARFTVLTSRLVRMEWSEDGRFEDRATLGIVNRRMPVPAFKVSRSGGKVTIKTDGMTLTYKGDGPFDGKNLEVSFNMPAGKDKKGRPVTKKAVWRPGMDDSGNLLGTTRTLDGCNGETTRDPFDKGVVSRDGWAVLDESTRQVFVPVESDWKNWVANRPEGKRQDLYLFAYGHDYTAAVSDFTKVAGRIPLPPKYSLGYWWCRFWQYSDFEFVGLGRQIRSFDIPIDVMVLDMDWHETWSLRRSNAPKDEFDQRIGWTGYTWNATLFPNPENHLQDLHDLGLKTTLNLHPASGIQPYEEPYDRFVKDYLSRTSDYDGPKGYIKEDGSKAPVPFRIDQEAWADAYFNSVIRPFEQQGVDFWWLDWQQWRLSKYTEGLSNTFWLNYTFFNDIKRQSAHEGAYARRPIIYHRWGGIGSHRYQIGFSGDTYATWKVLSYLPWFTSTASNVGYGYWGHDIGGHMQPSGVKETDPELYTRWIQSGVFTPIFKTHSTKDATMEKRFWVFPDHFDAMRRAIRLRYDLSPYIYGAARQTYDTGISMCRPLYYAYPEEEKAYNWKEEFLFGDDILATTVCTPADKTTGLAPRSMWFPAGNDWYDMATGMLYKGGTTADLKYTIDENPYFVKAGAIIPMASPDITSLQQKDNTLVLFVAPGHGKSETTVYEDDGTTQAYQTDFARTRVSKSSDARALTLTVGARKGSYLDMDPDRKLRVILEGVFAPARITVDGADVPYSRFAAREAAEGKSVWGYDGTELAVVLYLAEASADKEVRVEVLYDDYAATHEDLLRGKKGMIKRMMTLTPESKLVFAATEDPWKTLPQPIMHLAQCSSFILEDCFHAGSYLEKIDVDELDREIDALKLTDAFKTKLKAQIRIY